jgi:ribonuclease H2 subunit A
MVYAVAYCPVENKEALGKIGFADSKVLKEHERDELFETLKQNESELGIGWAIRSCIPQEISECMLQKSKYNLNALAHDVTIDLIQQVINKGVNVSEIYVDTVGPPASYQEKLSKIFPKCKVLPE